MSEKRMGETGAQYRARLAEEAAAEAKAAPSDADTPRTSGAKPSAKDASPKGK